VELSGTGFAPMPQDVLTDSPKAGMPEVTLQGPTPYTLPRERVFFVSGSQLNLDVPTRDSTPAQELTPGIYAVEVKNPSGTTGQLADALLVVPPPGLTAVTAPEGFTQTAPSPVVLTGSGFRAGEAPTVVIRGTGLAEVSLTDVTVVSATELRANVPPNTAPGTYDVVVTNPEGCAFTLPAALVISYARLGTLTMDPRFGWQQRNQAITLFNTPAGNELAFSGGAPEIFIVAPLKTNPAQPVDIPLRRVAFVSPSTVTAVVPTCSGLAVQTADASCTGGIVPGGPYALKVKDSNGAVGDIPAQNGFTVLENQPPRITSIAPSAITTTGLTSANPLVVTGEHFGNNARVQLLSQLNNGRIRACNLPATGTASATELRATVPGSIPQAECVEYTATGTQESATGGFAIAAGLYVVRVQNTQDPAYANYSGLIVTNPSANPAHGPALSSRLNGPRANFPLVMATDDLGQPYLYALGGTRGTDFSNDTLASVEVAPVTLFGDLGGQCTGNTCTFRLLERTPLGVGTAGDTPEPRRGHTAVVRTLPNDTSYLFVLGGVRPDGAAVNWIERAQVLKVADAPALEPPTSGTGGALQAGTFYYRVSALLVTSDPNNPGGETLPSDEYPATVGSAGGGANTLSWRCLPSARRYRIYRTVQPNAPSGSELMLDEIDAAACSGSPLPNVTYTDNGSKTPQGDAPLPPGALGRWVRLGKTLVVERGNAATRVVGDTVYVAGGFCSVAGSNCPAPNTTLASVERGTFTAGTADLDTFAIVGNLTQARQRHSLAVADATTAPNSFTPAAPDNSADAWLVAVGGDAGSTALTTNVFEVGKVKDANGPIAAPTFSSANYNAGGTHGGWSEIIANYLFQAGANGGTGFAFRSNFACPGTGNTVGKCSAANDFRGTLNSTSLSYQQGGPRYLSGNVLFRAFVYAAGGFPNDAGGTPTESVERIIY
jgi:hypothetical protein